MLADHKQQQRKQISNPASSRHVPDTHPHSKADAGEGSRSFTTTNNTCLKEGFSIPLFSFPDVSGHRRAWLMTCFIDVLQYLPYPTTRDGCVINPNAETGWNSLQEWRVSDNGSPRAEHSGNTLHKFWPCKFSLWSQKLVPLFSSLIYAVELHKKFRWPQPFIRA